MESAPLSITGAEVFAIRCRRQQLHPPHPRRWLVERSRLARGVRCLKEKGAFEKDREWKEMVEKLGREQCRGEVGIVGMLECLEKEAIMGEDSGKDPTDYDRRARIFHKCSEVFQALRDEAEHQHPTPPA